MTYTRCSPTFICRVFTVGKPVWLYDSGDGSLPLSGPPPGGMQQLLIHASLLQWQVQMSGVQRALWAQTPVSYGLCIILTAPFAQKAFWLRKCENEFSPFYFKVWLSHCDMSKFSLLKYFFTSKPFPLVSVSQPSLHSVTIFQSWQYT